MGQKVNPHGMRVGIIKPWNAQWFAEKKDFSKNLIEDYTIRTTIKKDYYDKAISRIIIERAAQKLIITIHTLKPAALIGTKGSEIEIIRKKIKKIVGASAQIIINIVEVKNADMDAQLVAENIALQLEKRISFRKAMKQAIQRTMKARGAKGIKLMVAGRLDGAEIARSEHYSEGSIPLQTIRADIDYGFAEAHTTFGVIGVKAWIYKGEILGKDLGGNANVNA